MAPMSEAGSREPTRDRELMVRARKGDQAAFAEIVRRNQQSLVNFFFRSGVRTEAEDLAQETFIRVYKYRDRYEPKAKFTTFMFMIARQVRVDWLRKRSRRWRLIESVREDPVIGPGVDANHGRAKGLDASWLLDRLPDAMREVVVLGMYQERPYAEISEILGIPEGTVKSRMYNALRKMRALLEHDANER